VKGKKDKILREDKKTSRDKPRGISDQIPYVLEKIDTKAIPYPLYIEAGFRLFLCGLFDVSSLISEKSDVISESFSIYAVKVTYLG